MVGFKEVDAEAHHGSPRGPADESSDKESKSVQEPDAKLAPEKDTKESADNVPGPYEESWEPAMAERIRGMVEAKEKAANCGEKNLQYPYCMVALCGIPGSGKTISSLLLANALESIGIEAMVMSHDGYHYPLSYLKTFPDAEDAIYHRGAPETFDSQALLRDLHYILGDEDSHATSDDFDFDLNIISLPGFDHAKGDPEPDGHTFDRSRHKVVICEGLYLLHDEDGWEEVASLFDLKIFLQADLDSCIDRLKIRNQCIPGYTPEEIEKRCEEVDRVNALTVMKSRPRADVVVKSKIKPVPASIHNAESTMSLQGLALAGLEQKDVDGAETNDNADWAMDIIPRSRPPTHSRSSSWVSTASETPPAPVSQFVGSWEPTIADRIVKSVDQIEEGSGKFPYMVALVGGPGSGKSVSSMLLASILEEQGYPTMVCPHDGYHYPLEHLRTFPNAEDVIYRRGAPDTFDPRALLRDLARIKEGDEDLIKLPAFDHATGDPEPDTHIFDRNQHKIVLCEGLYLLHDEDGWEDIAAMFDLSVFMNSDVDVCIERVKIRNQCIPGYTPEEIEERCERVDRVNAMTVLRSKSRANVIVDSMAQKH